MLSHTFFNDNRNKCPECWLYALTSALAILIALLALAMAKVWPFGSEYLTYMDNGQQVATDFGYVAQVLDGRSDLFWSYACGGAPRSSFHPTFNNLCSPLTWLLAFLPGLSILSKLSLLLVLQAALLPLGALFYVRRTFPRVPGMLTVLLALSYAFSEFLFAKYTALNLINPAILFPFFLYGLDQLLKRGKWWVYLVLLTYMLAVAAYYAWMWLLFAIVYAASRTGWHWHSATRQYNGRLLWMTLLSAALSAVWWYPSIWLTMESSRIGLSGTFYTQIALNAVPMREIWSFPAVAIALMVFSRSWKWSRYSLTAVVVATALVFALPSYVWHASTPIEYPGRFSYMLALMVIAAGVCGWKRGKHAGFRQLRGRHLALLVLVFLYAGYQVGLFAGGKIIMWLFSFAAFIYAWKTRRWLLGTLLCALAFSCVLAMHFNYNLRKRGEPFLSQYSRVLLAEDLGKDLERGEVFYGRVKSVANSLVDNVAFFTSYESMSHFTASCTTENVRTLVRWGYTSDGQIVTSEGGTIFSDTLFGNRYVVCGGGNPSRMPSLHDAVCWENPWYFGLGIMVPRNVRLDAEELSTLETHVAAMTSLLGGKAQFRIEKHQLPSQFQTGKWDYVLQGNEQLSDSCCYDSEVRERHGSMWRTGLPSPALQHLPAEQLVGIQPQDENEAANKEVVILSIDESTLDALAAYARALPVSVRYQGSRMYLSCESTPERDMLFLPLWWREGYSATDAAGNALDVNDYGGFVSISMPKPGKHEIVLDWAAPGSMVGRLISALGLVWLLCFLKWDSLLGCAKGRFNRYCRCGLLIANYTLLLLPALSFPSSLLWSRISPPPAESAAAAE